MLKSPRTRMATEFRSDLFGLRWIIKAQCTPLPIGSMYAIYGSIYHQYTPNVSTYPIHGSYGLQHKLCNLLPAISLDTAEALAELSSWQGQMAGVAQLLWLLDLVGWGQSSHECGVHIIWYYIVTWIIFIYIRKVRSPVELWYQTIKA